MREMTQTTEHNLSHAITVDFSPELLEKALGLPTGLKITGARWNSISRVLTLRLDHPSLPAVPEGSEPARAPLEEIDERGW